MIIFKSKKPAYDIIIEVKNNISLGKKVSNLLIDSIHAKLSIIDSLENIYKKKKRNSPTLW